MSEFNIGDEVITTYPCTTDLEGISGIVVGGVPRHDLVWVQFPGFSSYQILNRKDLKKVNQLEDLYPGETVSCVDEKTGQIEQITLGGTKHDNNKPDLSLLPLPAIEAISRVLSYGAKKYGRDNYRKGFSSERLVSATLRHLHAWNNGEDNDPESGLSHLGHAAATLVMLLTNQAEGKMTDTRYKGDK